MVTGVGHRDQAVGRVRPRALRLPKLLSATLESIHPNTPPPPTHTHTPVSDPHPPPPTPPPVPLPPTSTARHAHPPDVRKPNSSCISIQDLFFLFVIILLYFFDLPTCPRSSPVLLSSLLHPHLLSSSFLAVMEIRLEKSLILCASHRLRVRPSYLGEKREGNRQKGERGDKRERGAETDGQQARGGNGVDRWKKVKSGVCRRAASRQKWRWERAGDREMREGKQIYCL